MNKVLGLDVSTKTIGISLFDEDGKLILLTHVTPKIKGGDNLPDIELLIKKAQVFEEEFLEKYADEDITKVIIE
jgi:RNase H-fold protein (predicted Holliday junction resolvase)